MPRPDLSYVLVFSVVKIQSALIVSQSNMNFSRCVPSMLIVPACMAPLSCIYLLYILLQSLIEAAYKTAWKYSIYNE